MELMLIRHGLPEKIINEDGAPANPPLSETGHEQARKVKERQSIVLERQLELVPEDVRARILLAALYAGFGREDEAKRQAEMAVALRPNDANVLFNAACCYGVLDSKPEALGMLTRAFEAGYGNMDWAARDPHTDEAGIVIEPRPVR